MDSRRGVRVVTVLALACALSLGPLAPGGTATASAPVARPVVVGNVLTDAVTGQPWVPRGVNFPSFEYACAQGWGYSRSQASASTAQAIAAWNANVVRIPLNQDCWQGSNGAPVGAGRTAQGYRDAVVGFVAQLNAAGLVAVIDLHSRKTDTTANVVGQRAMPDAASVAFWASVADRFKSTPSVIFDAFNEPYSRYDNATNSWAFTLTWSCWKSGGCQAPVEDDYTGTLSGATYTVAGMDQIVATIRGAGAAQPIILAGLDYSNDLRAWLQYRPNDSQLIAGFHNYQGQRCQLAACWDAEVAPVAAVVPVVTGEFGANASTSAFIDGYMAWADQKSVGYLAWAWWVLDPGGYPLALLSDDGGTPRAPLGTALRAHLLSLLPSLSPCPTNEIPLLTSGALGGEPVDPLYGRLCFAVEPKAFEGVVPPAGLPQDPVPPPATQAPPPMPPNASVDIAAAAPAGRAGTHRVRVTGARGWAHPVQAIPLRGLSRAEGK